MPPNGSEELHKAVLSAFERVAVVLSRMNTAMRSMSDTILEHSARREREHDAIRSKLEDIRRDLVAIESAIEETRSDVKDATDPRIQIPNQVKDQSPDNKSGPLVIFARLAEKMPTPWVSWLLKLAVSSGFGAAVLRGVQWLTTGH